MHIIEFTHPVSNELISITTSKRFVVIYGKNGVGKTTLSKAYSQEHNYVFNEDYINKNVYSTSHSGTSISSENRKNISEFWLGEETVSKAKERESLERILKDIKNENKNTLNKYKLDLAKYDISDSLILNEYKINDFLFNEDNWMEDLSQYTYNDKKNTSINDNNVSKIYKQIKNNLTLNSLNKKIISNLFIKSLIIDKSDKFIIDINVILDDLDKKHDYLNQIEKYESDLKDPENAKSLLKNMYTYHVNHELSNCLFCGNDDISVAMKNWKKVFSDRLFIAKDKLIDELKTINNDIDNLINEESFKEIEPNMIIYLSNLKMILSETLTNLNKNEYNMLEVEKYDGNIMAIKTQNKIEDEMFTYILNKYLDKLIYLYNSEIVLDKGISDLKIDIDRLMNSESKEYENQLNRILGDLGLDKEIEIGINKRSSIFTYDIKIKNQNVDSLSNGQKHRLALAIFLLNLENEDINNKNIIIDDPVVSLDAEGYLQVRSYIQSKIIKEKIAVSTGSNLIILTHDYQYMFVQLYDILDKSNMLDKTAVMRLTENSLRELDINFLFSDDIVLFKELLNSIENKSELKKITYLSSKIFRLIVDIKQREMGIPQYNDVNLNVLEYTKNEKKIIESFYNHYNDTFRSGKSETFKDSDIITSLIHLKNACNVMGFTKLIEKEHIEKFDKIIKNKTNDVPNDKPIFLIVDSINKFIDNNSNKVVLNYINHPRNSFTKNLITLILDDNL